MPALHAAVAFPEVDHVAVQIGEDLDLDVPRSIDVFFEVDVAIAEGGFGFGLGLLERDFSDRSLPATRIPRPPPPATALISTGKPTSWARRSASSSLSTTPSLPGTTGTPALPGNAPGLVLVAEPSHRLGSRADEVDLAAAANFVEMGVLGQETVARVDRLHVADLRRADHVGDFQIAVGRLGRADAIGLVGERQIVGVPVGFAEDRDRLDAQFAAGANHAEGDLSPVGDQDALIHRANCRRSEVRGQGQA